MVTSSAYSHPTLNTLTPGALFRQYKLLEQIGVGGQGVVWSALHETQKCIYAIKFNEVPDTNEGEADEIRDEYQLAKLVTLDHPHILPLEEYGFEERIRFTVSPYLSGGTLTEKIKPGHLSFDEILRYGAEVASALDYLHGQGIIHRDLKSSNILLDTSNNAYLADFGLARIVSASTMAFHTGHGTPPYAPPEQIQLKAITPKSDVFSFGILLYELFTGQLPWGGKRQLGMEQTHSRAEIPNPCEFNDALPAAIWDIFRRVTSATPGERPNSTGEVMKMMYYLFKTPPESQIKPGIKNKATICDRDAEELLKSGLSKWETSNGVYNLGLTRFALIDLYRSKINTDIYGKFVLSQAINYGYNDDEWWTIVNNPKDRLMVSSLLLGKNNDAITARIIEHLKSEVNTNALPKGLPNSITISLLETGIKTDNVFLRKEIFDGIRTLTRQRNEWDDRLLQPSQLKRLGDLAIEDSDIGDTTAELIGHLRSPSAIKAILKYKDDERKMAALSLIQKVAGSLPTDVQADMRLRLSMSWIVYRLTQRPVSLASAYILAFFGAALGVGIQVYFTYNFPSFLDTVRLTTSLEQGLIIGAIFGLGIFSTRVIVERFQSSNAFLRIALGTCTGLIGLNICLLIFHILFVSTPPKGFSITVACLLIALGFAISGLIRSRLLRMILSSFSVFAAILGTWWIHINFAASPVDLTPVFRYDYSWPLTQIALIASVIAVSIGIFGNLIDLSIIEN
ncbi:MAG: serine/threonine protein kinase [Anaerolineales bacterium]|nr:serine/threonine protein kinase [Anaerolineales bacterium]